MSRNDNGDAERDAVNKGLQTEEERLSDPDRRPPHSDADEDRSGSESTAASQETSEADIAHLENPPQTDGPRERSNEGV